MLTRTTETTVTFRRTFSLESLDAAQPAGTYRLVLEEDEIPGLSFPAYRRVTMVLHTPAVSSAGGLRQEFPVDAADLEAALERDSHPLAAA